MDKRMFEILACPICKGDLLYQALSQEVICKFDRVAYPIIDHIPVMLPHRARHLSPEELLDGQE